MSLEGPQNREVPTLRTYKIEMPGGNFAEFVPERGGIIASLKLKGKDVLHKDPHGLAGINEKMRGGMLHLFPQGGPVKNPLYPNLPQHGFARDSSRWTHSISGDKKSIVEELISTTDTLQMYKYRFLLRVEGLFQDDAFVVKQEVTNFEEYKDMPVAMGLHPYFEVENKYKGDIKFNFSGGDELTKRKDEWMSGKAVVIESPRMKIEGGKEISEEMRIKIPEIGELVLIASPEYQKIVVWSEPGGNYICVEPWVRGVGGLVDNAHYVSPSETFSASFSIRLER